MIEGMPSSLAPLKRALMVLTIPGLLGSAILGRNVHAFSIAFAMLINGILYFAVGWTLFLLWAKIKRRR
jgi:hypothetical protein